MPPQPLSSVKRDATYSHGTPTFLKYPHLAVYISEVIATGSEIDNKWSAILIDLLRADTETGMAMYSALSGAEARRTVLKAAAKTRLSKDDHLLFEAVLKTTAHARRLRNDFGHHIWGTSDAIPDAFLLIDPLFPIIKPSFRTG